MSDPLEEKLRSLRGPRMPDGMEQRVRARVLAGTSEASPTRLAPRRAQPSGASSTGLSGAWTRVPLLAKWTITALLLGLGAWVISHNVLPYVAPNFCLPVPHVSAPSTRPSRDLSPPARPPAIAAPRPSFVSPATPRPSAAPAAPPKPATRSLSAPARVPTFANCPAAQIARLDHDIRDPCEALPTR